MALTHDRDDNRRSARTTFARLRPWAASALVASGLAPVTLAADGRTYPEHAWGYPFCGEQPAITAVFDHEHPTYGAPPNADPDTGRPNGTVRLYNDTVQNHRAYDGHAGWDYRTRLRGRNVKQPVFAVAPGIVTYAGWHEPGSPDCDHPLEAHERGFGLVVAIRHADGTSLYGHLSAVHVEAGQSVAAGCQVGSTGATGNAAGPHLHFGAFAPDPYSLWHGFDPYGWNRDWQGLADLPLPAGTDPWHAAGGPASRRVLLPGAPDHAPCPQPCPNLDPTIVDDRDPGFAAGCWAPPCDGWMALPSGYRGHAVAVRPNGTRRSHWATWTAQLPAGRYRVEAFVPFPAAAAAAHAARYELGSRRVVVDQHAEANVWVDLGTHDFPAAPVVQLTDASWIGGWRDSGACRAVIADAVRFSPICPDGSEAP